MGENRFIVYLKMDQSRPLFVYLRPFVITASIIQIEKSIVGVLGIRTRSLRMVDADNTPRAMAAAHKFIVLGKYFRVNVLPHSMFIL